MRRKSQKNVERLYNNGQVFEKVCSKCDVQIIKARWIILNNEFSRRRINRSKFGVILEATIREEYLKITRNRAKEGRFLNDPLSAYHAS